MQLFYLSFELVYPPCKLGVETILASRREQREEGKGAEGTTRMHTEGRNKEERMIILNHGGRVWMD